MLGQFKKVLKYAILPYRLRATTPINKLILSNTHICLKIKLPSGVARPQGNALYLFTRIEEARKRAKDARGVNDNVDLTGNTLHRYCGIHKRIVDTSRGAEAIHVLGSGAYDLTFEVCKTAGQRIALKYL